MNALAALLLLAAQAIPVLRPGETTHGELIDGMSSVRSPGLSAGGVASALGTAFTLEAENEGVHHVELRSHEFDAYLVARDGEGEVLGEDDDGLVNQHARLVLELRPDRPVIVYACALRDGRGSFTISLRAGPPEILDGVRLQEAALADAQDRIRHLESTRGPGHPDLVPALNGLARVLFGAADTLGARDALLRSLEVQEGIVGPDDVALIPSLANLAMISTQVGDLDGAQALFARAQDLIDRLEAPNPRMLATIVNNRGLLLRELGRPTEARDCYERALASLTDVPDADPLDIATMVNNLGDVCILLGDPERGRTLHLQALATRQELLGEDDLAVAESLHNLGFANSEAGDVAESRRCYERALAIRQAVLGDEHTLVASTLGSLGIVLQQQGDLLGARVMLARALAVRHAAVPAGHPDLALDLSRLGGVLQDLGELDAARPLLENALELAAGARRPDHPLVATAANNLGRLLREQGELEAARAVIEQALTVCLATQGPDHPETAIAHNNLGLVLHQLGAFPEARSQFEASARGFQEALGDEHRNLASVLANTLALQIDAGAESDTTALIRRLDELREGALRSGLWGLSERELHDLLAELRWQLELRTTPRLLRGPEALVEGYEALLAWKGWVLREATRVRRRLHDLADEDVRQTLAALRHVTSQLSGWSARTLRGEAHHRVDQLPALVEERARLERSLVEATRLEPEPLPRWSDLRDALPPRSALVDVVVTRAYMPGALAITPAGGFGPPHAMAWVTRPGDEHPRQVVLGSAADIEAAATRRLRELVGTRGAGVAPNDEQGLALRRLVWDPLAPLLADAELIFVSPDGPLSVVPYGVLRSDDGRFLLEERAFLSLSDPTSLIRRPQAARVPRRPQLLAVGGLDYGPERGSLETSAARTGPRGAWQSTWLPLEGTALEVADISRRHAALHDAGGAATLTGGEATEAALKDAMPKASIIHLATHGYFERDGVSAGDVSREGSLPSRPTDTEGDHEIAARLEWYHPGLLSGLVCSGVNTPAPEGGEDGLLTAEEVAWLDLSGVDLVVLSACDTGLGQARAGEGLLGLRRAFLTAGAGTVISSLWSIPDQETVELMDRFYAHLWEEGRTPSDALRQAQLDVIAAQRARHGASQPRSWGAFVIDGDWR
jgi:CHAT domain-containing protein/tetratricopeptide (TPR) repeat protein